MKIFIIIIIIAVVIGGAYAYFMRDTEVPSPDTDDDSSVPVATEPFQYKDLVLVTSPRSGSTVESPVELSGRARGNWYFEASFPIKILDEDGTIIGNSFVQAQGEWMTTDYVPFAGQVTFSKPKGSTGKIVFEKDNPSGLPEHDDSFSIPVKFE
jgi:hypothetical protein